MAEAVAAEPLTGSPQGGGPPLDELMLAMDVVDTLRHAERLVERELSSEQRDAQLRERLREIYRSQGIEIPDRVLDEGVEALKEDRFVYRPPPPGFAHTLARVWVGRDRWGPVLLLLLALFGAGWAAYTRFWVLPEERRTASLAHELAEDLPRVLATEMGRIKAVSRDQTAAVAAERLVAEGSAAARAGDAAGARAKVEALQTLRGRLEQSYTLRIVSRPQQPSGVFRIPRANAGARNYYVIVEALDSDGKAVKVPVTSEEDGRTDRVSQWGIRVDESVYQRMRADKQDDGIIQQNRFGEKRSGYLDPDYAFPTRGGAILNW